MLKSYNEEIIVKKDKLKFIFILILAVLLFSCTKEVKEQKPVEAKVETSTKIEPKENEFLSKPEYSAPKKTAEQLEAEEKYKKSEEYKYEQKIKQLRAKVGIKPDFMGTYNPYIVKDIDLINNKLIIPASYENVQYVDVENIEYDGKIYRCTQKIEIKPETFLEYKMTLEYNPHAEVYVVLENELITPINIGKINETTIENQVNGEILTLKDDKDSIQLIKLFEDYEKENYPIFFSNMDKLKVLDYVKGNFTNSGYDEYVVFFIFDGDTKNYVNILHCFIVKNDKIIQEYPIILPYDEEYIDNREIIHFGGELKYKFAFSTGFVADFNQNYINELYFKTVFVGGWTFYRAEFEDNFFNVKEVFSPPNHFSSLKWSTKTMTVDAYEEYIYSQTDTSSGSDGYAEFQWSEDLNDFILKYKKITEKYGWEKPKE